MKDESIKKLVLTAVFFALGIVLPFVTGQVPQIGKMLLPMHIPVFLCAFICGWRYAAVIGFVLPVTRSLLYTMPALFPDALAMTFELAAYGFAAGLLYDFFRDAKWNIFAALYCSLIPAMIIGRLVWGAVSFLILGLSGSAFTFSAFIAGALLNAFPGIILQLILVPAIVLALDRAKLVRFQRT